MKYFILSSLCILLFSGCSYKNNLNKNFLDTKIKKLSNLIISSSSFIDKNEAKDFSKKIILQSMVLAKQYNVTTTPLIHNTLIHMNLRKRGFCYHYANDLKKYIKKQNYQTFYLIKLVSKRGKYFEHTSLALTNKYIKYEDSIILDAWRNAGDLYFSKIKDDKRYKWEIK